MLCNISFILEFLLAFYIPGTLKQCHINGFADSTCEPITGSSVLRLVSFQLMRIANTVPSRFSCWRCIF